MSNFFRWLADVGPTLGRRSKSRWADVGSHRRADGCADVGPTLARRQHAIWDCGCFVTGGFGGWEGETETRKSICLLLLFSMGTGIKNLTRESL